MDPHRLAEARSLAYHRLVAERIADDPSLLARARAQVARWIADGRSRYYIEAWSSLLAGPPDRLRALLTDESEHARALRQHTPFAGALSADERWRLWRTVKAEHAG